MLWNEFLSDFYYTCDTDISELRNAVKQWKGPSLDPSQWNYVWAFVGGSILIWSGWYTWVIFLHTLTISHVILFSSWVIYVHNDLELYIFALSQSRMLAHWLMLFVVKTTINKVDLNLSSISTAFHDNLLPMDTYWDEIRYVSMNMNTVFMWFDLLYITRTSRFAWSILLFTHTAQHWKEKVVTLTTL